MIQLFCGQLAECSVVAAMSTSRLVLTAPLFEFESNPTHIYLAVLNATGL